MTPRIVVGNRIHESVAARLKQAGEVILNDTDTPLGADALRERCSEADALMAFMTERVDAAFLDACPKLRIVGGALKGYNNFDVDACTERGVAVTVCPDLLTEPTAELTLGLMIAVARYVGFGDRLVRSDAFEGWRPVGYGRSITGATVGVLGAGAVGQALFRLLRGFDCTCLYHDPKPLSPTLEAELGARYAEPAQLLANSDFLVLAVHLMADNRHMVNAGFLAAMKPQAYLINPARGSLVDEAAVADALAAGHLAGYAADTFELEDWQLDDRPRHVDPRLRASDQTIFTPHLGSAVRNVREAIENSAATSIIQALEGKRPDGLVNSSAFNSR
ncbi:MAG: NAD(P)-dependent oxidoreductase [Pseudomonadota bacterium]